MALTAPVNRDHFVDQSLREFPVAADAVIHKGALLSVDSNGMAAPLTAGELFIGVAYESADATGLADGAKKVRAFTQGDFVLPLGSAAATDTGLALYASDDGTLTKTALNNTFVGHIVHLHAAGEVVVRIAPFATAP